MQADPCVSSNAPSLGASGEPGHLCWRDGLFYKMLKMGIGGNFIKVLQSMYSQTKYAVKVDNRISEPFLSSVGVKQGCVLSPLLFNLYLSDLPCIFDNSCDLLVWMHCHCLLFADDLLLLSESSQGLNACINRLDTYCRKWGLTINLAETKVIIFNKGGHKISKFNFFYKTTQLRLSSGTVTGVWYFPHVALLHVQLKPFMTKPVRPSSPWKSGY